MSTYRLHTPPRPHRMVTQTSGVIFQPTTHGGDAMEPKLRQKQKKMNKNETKTGDASKMRQPREALKDIQI